MNWSRTAGPLAFQPNRPAPQPQVPTQPGAAPAQPQQVPAQPGQAPQQGLQTMPKTQTEVFFEWVAKYAPQVWTQFQQMEQALMTEIDPQKRLGLQKVYQQMMKRKFDEWQWKMQEAQKVGQPESAVQLAFNWYDMVKLANALDFNTDDQNIPQDSSMPPCNKCKLHNLWKRKKKPVDPDSQVPGLSQEPPLGQR